MRKSIHLILIGCIPLIMGALVNVLVTSGISMPVFLISLIALFIWYFIGRRYGIGNSEYMLINTPAIFFFMLVVVQEIALGAYMQGAIGMLSQMFFLPFVSAGALVAGWTGSMAGIYTGCFILMLLCSYIGARQRMRGR